MSDEDKVIWCVMDGRANYDIDAATLFVSCENEEEARAIVKRGDYGEGCVAVPFKEAK